MWFKKKSVLQAEGNYDTEKSADRTTDLRTTGNRYDNDSRSINSGVLPSAADAGNYFFLPALGSYDNGRLKNIGGYTCYWSSSAYPGYSIYAYCLYIMGGTAIVSSDYRERAHIVEPTVE